MCAFRAWTHFAVAAPVTGQALGLPRCFVHLEGFALNLLWFGCLPDRCGGGADEWMGSPFFHAVFVHLEGCPFKISGPGYRRTAAAVGALDFARCYRSLRTLSPSRPPLLEDNARRFGGLPDKSGLRYSIAAFFGFRPGRPPPGAPPSGGRVLCVAFPRAVCSVASRCAPRALVAFALRSASPAVAGSFGRLWGCRFVVCVPFRRLGCGGRWGGACAPCRAGRNISVTGNCRQGAVMEPPCSPGSGSHWSLAHLLFRPKNGPRNAEAG